MSRLFLTKVAPIFKSRFMTRCDGSEDDEEPSDLMKQADTLLHGEKLRISTPPQYENFGHVFNQARVNNYDGCRFIVQKQVNLNTQATHFFWFGTAARPPMYQYRITIPQDSFTITAATDPDFNVEGELNVPLPTPENSVWGRLNLKSAFTLGDAETAGTHFNVEVERTDDSSALQLQHSFTENTSTIGFMQTLYPGLVLGGQLAYQHKGKDAALSVAGSYTNGEHVVAAQVDSQMQGQAVYVRKVNEGRANIGAGLVMAPQGGVTAAVSGEFNLKTGKVAVSFDSNMTTKSTLDHYVGDGTEEPLQSKTVQLCAEANQYSGEYKFGIGFVMG